MVQSCDPLVILPLHLRLIQKFASLFSKSAKLNLLLLQLCVNICSFLSSSKKNCRYQENLFPLLSLMFEKVSPFNLERVYRLNSMPATTEKISYLYSQEGTIQTRLY